MSTLDDEEEGDQYSDQELGSIDELTSRDAVDDSLDATGVESSSGVDVQRTRLSSGQVKNEEEGDILVAQPPKEREGSDYHAVAISGTSALDILDQVDWGSMNY